MAIVGIDARICRSWSTGVGVYTTSLLEALCRVAPEHGYVLFTSPDAPPAPFPEALPAVQHALGVPVAGLRQHTRLSRALRAFAMDALIVNHPASAPLWPPCPSLVFVHDLIPLVLPQYYGAAKRAYFRTAVRWSLARARSVLVDSESTKQDCRRLLGVAPERMRVVYGGVGPEFRSASHDAIDPRARPYLLYVGNRRPHKNVDRLIEAFALLRRNLDCQLVIAGREGPGDIETDGRRLRELCGRLALDGDVRFAGEVPGEDLPALYAGAAAFVSLSSYEGFGLPPLEAMACGTPVVALRVSSLPEVVGDGGVLLESAEAEVVAPALEAILRDPTRRAALSARAARRARKFSWDRTARLVAAEIEGALEARVAA